MQTSWAIAQFGSSAADLARVLGITRSAVAQWGETVPELRQYQIRELLAQRSTEAIERVYDPIDRLASGA